MNIYLIPYTWMRHFAVAIFTAGICLVVWWLVLAFVVVIKPPWDIYWDGAVFLGMISAVTAGSSQLAETSLRRLPPQWRFLRTGGAIVVTLLTSMLSYLLWSELIGPAVVKGLISILGPTLELLRARVLGGEGKLEDLREVAENAADSSLVSLRYRLGVWAMVGLNTGLWAAVFRKGSGMLSHLGAGLLAGIAGGMVWFVVGYANFALGTNSLYLASALGAMTFGGIFGLFAWGIPNDLYAGWLRVVTETRFGRRIPIDAKGVDSKERFVGHYPRGLDLYLPADEGVMEMHVSVLVDDQQQYHLRGLTIAPTRLERLLERVNLRYDPTLPAPKEVELQSGDRILLGAPGQHTVLEFLMLPREEQ